METTEKSLWSKTQDELTVADSLKVGLGVTVIMTAAPVLLFGAFAAIGSRLEKRRVRKASQTQPTD